LATSAKNRGLLIAGVPYVSTSDDETMPLHTGTAEH